MRKLDNNGRLGVSAVIGVIMMVAITVAIAATVYVYVSGINEERAGPDVRWYDGENISVILNRDTWENDELVISFHKEGNYTLHIYYVFDYKDLRSKTLSFVIDEPIVDDPVEYSFERWVILDYDIFVVK